MSWFSPDGNQPVSKTSGAVRKIENAEPGQEPLSNARLFFDSTRIKAKRSLNPFYTSMFEGLKTFQV